MSAAIPVDVHEWVEGQLDAARAKHKDRPMTPGDEAAYDLLAIVMYGEKVPAVTKVFEKIYHSCAVVIGSDADPAAAARERTANLPARYHVNDRMQALLAACRAGQFVDLQVK